MGISHPLSDEFYGQFGGGGGVMLSPERTTPPSSPPPPTASSCSPVDEDFLEHEVSRMDTLAGIAIKYGAEISDIKRANSLMTDSQMFAHKTLIIPLPGRPIPSPVRSSGPGHRTKRTSAPNHQQNGDITDLSKSAQQRSSLAMSTLQSYCGLGPQKGDYMDCSTEMSMYSNATPDTRRNGRSWDSRDPRNGFPPINSASGTSSKGATKAKQDGSMRRRQKVEADRLSDTQVDFLTDPIKAIKSLLPRPVSSISRSVSSSSPDFAQKSSNSFFNGFASLRKSPSEPNFADSENGISMWSSSKWTFNHESFTRPLLDGLPKTASVCRSKAALD